VPIVGFGLSFRMVLLRRVRLNARCSHARRLAWIFTIISSPPGNQLSCIARSAA
jgi:hypothetical protein